MSTHGHRRIRLSTVIGLTAGVLLACKPTDQDTPPQPPIEQPVDAPVADPVPTSAYAYPASRRGDVVDNLHGVDVPDPYRWLEDLDSDETRAWVEAQNKLTFGYLDTVPERAAIRARMTELWNFERFGLPRKAGKNYFYTRNDGLQNQSVTYITPKLDAEGKVFLDPNTLSTDGTVALHSFKPSPNGKLVCYGLQSAGSDWEEFRVREVATGKDLPDLIKWSKFAAIAWTKDNKGFFYGRFAEPKEGDAYEGSNFNHKIYYHRLGDPQDKDVRIYERPDHKKWSFDAEVTEDGRYVILTVQEGTAKENAVLIKDLKGGPDKGEFTELMNKFDAEYAFVANKGTTLYFRTNAGAPRGKVIKVNLGKPAPDQWKDVVPEAKETLRGVSAVGGKLFAKYLKDAHSQVKEYTLAGKLVRDVALPGIGSAYGFGGKLKDKETFYAYSSYNTPATVYRHDVRSGKSSVFKAPKVAFNPADYETKQVFYTSKDGTKVPMFISHKKGLELNGTNPTYLYGYGGFDIPITPGFKVQNLIWMEMGGVFAVANLRGGGEYGVEWHEAGMKLNKQNVFDDFISAAEYLIAEKYTTTDKLAVGGRSNGGLLIGAVITQRPELFGAALPGVGVMDMLRFHKFTIGHAWTSDYGSPENPEEFKVLHSYSPLHNTKPGTAYPATLVYTADHDDRVVPGHSYKFAAALQHDHRGDNPVMIRIDTKAGHGAGKPTSKSIDEWTDLWGFLVANLGMEIGLKAPG